MSMTPTVGRIVHYVSYGTPGGEFTSECRAALVTGVHSSEVVDLAVLNPTGLFFQTGLQLDESDQDPVGGTWHWPEQIPGV